MTRVAQDGMRGRAHAKAASLRRRDRLMRLFDEAKAQVHTLKQELHDDPAASNRRKRAARERAAREREQRLSKALATMTKIEKVRASKKKPAKPPAANAAAAPSPSEAEAAKPPKPDAEPRVSAASPRSARHEDG